MRITDFQKVKELNPNDLLIADGEQGSRTIFAQDLALQLHNMLDPTQTPGGYFEMLEKYIPGEQHRNYFRGKNLGNVYTDEQKQAVRDGTFHDLWLGDYWVIGDIIWRIVDFDYWYGFFKTDEPENAVSKHHFALMPDTTIYNIGLNQTQSTENGYSQTYFFKTGKSTVNESKIYPSWDREYVLSRPMILSNSVTDGVVTSTIWVQDYINIPNEMMIYGDQIHLLKNPDQYNNGCVNEYTQLSLFSLRPEYIVSGNHETYWLYDVAGSKNYGAVHKNGYPTMSLAATNNGIRPVFGITGGEA